MFINNIVSSATTSVVRASFFCRNRFRCYASNLCVASLMFITSGTEAYTQEYVVTQEHQKFSELFLKIDKHDAIKIVNLDSVTHKLSFSYKERTQSFTDIAPGGNQLVEFNQPGVYDIKCHLYPDMRLTVFVPYTYGSNSDGSQRYSNQTYSKQNY